MSNPADALTAAPAAGDPPARPRPALPHWAAPATLAAILVLSAALYGWALGSLGWGNVYYAAAVKSMGESWTNFLFGSFDPAGVVTVDKPPAALWPQVISSKIFGMHGWALILPQLLEGVAAVLVLHRTVRRWAGEGAALLAALVMTLTPITVAINRDNNPDTLLVLLLVCAAYALTRALGAASPRAATWWLCASGFLIGCGFLTKMMAAWMVIPAFTAAWLVGATGSWAGRIWRLLTAGAVLAVSSLWWVAMVAWWPGSHPYIGGSTDGGAWNLVMGYNGLGRLFGEASGSGSGGSGGMGQIGGAFGGSSGLLRLFDDQNAGQISWLLPVCAAALVVAAAFAVLRRRGVRVGEPLAASGWLLWGVWLVVCAAVFSLQEGTFHPYYETELTPAVAVMVAGLVVALARAHRAGATWALPIGAVTVVVTGGWAIVVIRRVPSWHGWLAWLVAVLGLAAVALLVAAGRQRRLLPAALAGAVLAVLAAPTAWAVSVPSNSTSAIGGTNPTAGPASVGFGGMGPGGKGSGFPANLDELKKYAELGNLPGFGGTGAIPGGGTGARPGGGQMPTMPSGGSGFPGGFPGMGSGSKSGAVSGGAGGARAFGDTNSLTTEQRKILEFAVRNSGSARIKLAIEGGATRASAYILDSDATVIGMGGFLGSDNAPSVQQLEKWTKDGELRYILGSGSGGAIGMLGGSTGANPAADRSKWISSHCSTVPASAYGGTSGSSQDGSGPAALIGGSDTLYDCAPK